MRITSKGQVTIPLEVRKQCGLLPHTEVEFHVNRSGKAVLVPKKPRTSPMASWLRKARGIAKGRFTTDEVMRQTRGEGWNRERAR
jgi:AbrB family looped-hinge helix DNA binding protein